MHPTPWCAKTILPPADLYWGEIPCEVDEFLDQHQISSAEWMSRIFSCSSALLSDRLSIFWARTEAHADSEAHIYASYVLATALACSAGIHADVIFEAVSANRSTLPLADLRAEWAATAELTRRGVLRSEYLQRLLLNMAASYGRAVRQRIAGWNAM